MKLPILDRPVSGRCRRRDGFTIMEVVIAMSLGVLVVGAFAVFTESTGRTLVSLTSQSSHNQYAGNGTEFLVSRIRQANTAFA